MTIVVNTRNTATGSVLGAMMVSVVSTFMQTKCYRLCTAPQGMRRNMSRQKTTSGSLNVVLKFSLSSATTPTQLLVPVNMVVKLEARLST